MKNLGILSVALVAGFAMSSSFAFWGHTKTIELKDLSSGKTQTAPVPQDIQSGATLTCKAPKIEKGEITLKGFDNVVTFRKGMEEANVVYLGNAKVRGITAVGSPDLKLGGLMKSVKCTVEKNK